MGVKLRAILARLHGVFQQQDWESICQQSRKHRWLTDGQSLRDDVVNPIVAGCEDKRLEIDLDGL
eukprot:914227-Karenia_brevis.AAC.1